MIKIFGKTDTAFDSNGDVVIQPLRAKVTKQDNGDFYLNIDAPLEYVDLFIEDNIIQNFKPSKNQNQTDMQGISCVL